MNLDSYKGKVNGVSEQKHKIHYKDLDPLLKLHGKARTLFMGKRYLQ